MGRVERRGGLITHLGRRMRCRSLAPGGNILVGVQFHGRSNRFGNDAQAQARLGGFLLRGTGKLVG
jgi:hypothetical protein